MSIFNRLFGKDAKVRAPEASTEDISGADTLIREANVLEDEGDYDRAISLYERALVLAPNHWRAHLNLGNAMLGCKRIPEAVRAYRKVIELNPSGPQGHYSIANAFLAGGNARDAEVAYRNALDIRPDWSEAWVGLGATLQAGQPDAAEAAYRKSLELDPTYGIAATRLSMLLESQGHATRARAVIDEVLRHAPNNVAARIAYAEQCARAGDAESAAGVYRKLADELPSRLDLASAYLFALNLTYDIAAELLLAEHVRMGQRITAMALPGIAHGPDAAGDAKRLKIGYVSPDLIAHPVANFLVPVLRRHDRERFEVHCFHLNASSDAITDQIRSLSDHWHDVSDLSDQQLSRRVVDNGIDILVDLAGHTSGNRLRVFAGKPAPIQCTWLGYLGTTGVEGIDYRLCDRFTDPPDIAPLTQTERPAYLSWTQWCYEPLRTLPPVNELPWSSNGYWTFGSFNQGRKLHARTLALWATLLREIPDSKLLVIGILDDVLASRIVEIFASRGVGSDRLTIWGRMPIADYLASFHEVDMALDTYPYNGVTTTLDGLLMGVPVVTHAGSRTITRGAGSLLRAIGHDDWIAPSEAEFVPVVMRQCSDPARLQALRRSLRPLVEASCLMDGSKFTQDLETFYETAWRARSQPEPL